jgi:hypothetical protein
MKKASEYRKHADECRALALTMADSAQRDQLLEMAATWDNLARDRSELVQRHPELAFQGEHQEEAGRPSPEGAA